MFHLDKDVRIDLAAACQFQEIEIDLIEIFADLISFKDHTKK